MISSSEEQVDENEKKTRLCRLDSVVTVTVQIEVDAAATPQQAHDKAREVLNAAIDRLLGDSKVHATSVEGKFLDPSGHRASSSSRKGQ